MTTRPRGLAVTGTDTGVGKTTVSAVLTRLLAGVYVKPVQSGAADGDDDAAIVRSLVDCPTVVGTVLEDALAPSVAARRDGRIVERADLLAVVHRAAQQHPGHAVVGEGAGGLLVDLGTDGTTIAHLAEDLRLPLVIVARPGLGTLNHTLLTLEAADRRGLAVLGVVISGMPDIHEDDPDHLALSTNIDELQGLSSGMVIGVVPRLIAGARLPELDVLRSWVGPALGGTWQP